ncbi:hypothetical protein Zmor_023178 [Zophobas morio]|uniref:Uncharacterized protein n=1 Tax=Zophobas morio TaxID=2755281 RepID=A0AA38M673_9CUCU|nr:hypothetical protein Zmor_023178 [Zophobas morio]
MFTLTRLYSRRHSDKIEPPQKAISSHCSLRKKRGTSAPSEKIENPPIVSMPKGEFLAPPVHKSIRFHLRKKADNVAFKYLTSERRRPTSGAIFSALKPPFIQISGRVVNFPTYCSR